MVYDNDVLRLRKASLEPEFWNDLGLDATK